MTKLTKEETQIITAVEKKIGYTFKKKQYLMEALTHRSYSNELRKKGLAYNNERMEFLGDAVLELIVSDYLFRTYPELPEGIMTLVRSNVVKTTSLSLEVARLELGNHLFLGHGEEKTGGRNKEYLLANLFESIIGAIYLDGGIKHATAFVKKNLFNKIEETVNAKDYVDPKTKLQEIAQQHFKITPVYTIIHESGPAHERTYVAAVHIGDKELSNGEGSSKQKAEESAAVKALELLANLIQESHAQD